MFIYDFTDFYLTSKNKTLLRGEKKKEGMLIR